MSRSATQKPISQAAGRKDTVVNLRMPRQLRDMIDNAAAALGKTRTDFIIDSSRKQATDVLLDQRLFTLDDKQHKAFLRALDAPAVPNAKLKRMMASQSPWEA